jgi:hypothetical protein
LEEEQWPRDNCSVKKPEVAKSRETVSLKGVDGGGAVAGFPFLDISSSCCILLHKTLPLFGNTKIFFMPLITIF